jgi:hypothetical protein
MYRKRLKISNRVIIIRKLEDKHNGWFWLYVLCYFEYLSLLYIYCYLIVFSCYMVFCLEYNKICNLVLRLQHLVSHYYDIFRDLWLPPILIQCIELRWPQQYQGPKPLYLYVLELCNPISCEVIVYLKGNVDTIIHSQTPTNNRCIMQIHVIFFDYCSAILYYIALQ